MPTIKLNSKTELGSLMCPEGKTEIVFWADDLPGFGLRCRARNKRSWFVQYRTKAGDMRKHTLGGPPTVKFAKARSEAEQLLSAAKIGRDPAGDVKRAKEDKKNAVRVGELV